MPGLVRGEKRWLRKLAESVSATGKQRAGDCVAGHSTNNRAAVFLVRCQKSRPL